MLTRGNVLGSLLPWHTPPGADAPGVTTQSRLCRTGSCAYSTSTVASPRSSLQKLDFGIPFTAYPTAEFPRTVPVPGKPWRRDSSNLEKEFVDCVFL